jgi:hypothetical protein
VEEKRVHLNLKVRPRLKAELERRAAHEKRSLGNLAETLLDWSEERLEAAGDSIALLRLPKLPISRRISQETQEQLYTALSVIIRDAPSAQIEALARYLTRLAGKYGEEDK